jgi:hypothetical protein
MSLARQFHEDNVPRRKETQYSRCYFTGGGILTERRFPRQIEEGNCGVEGDEMT